MTGKTTLRLIAVFFIVISAVYLIFMLAFIRYYKKQLEREHKQQLIQVVSIARNAMEPVVEEYRQGKLAKTEAINRLRILARTMIFEDSFGDNYLFMADWNGNNLVQPFHPENELTNMWHFQDSRGNYVVQELVRISRETPEGGFYEYWLNLPGKLKDQKKSAYVVGIPELQCYLGTGIYAGENQKSQNRILRIIILGSLFLVLILALFSQFTYITISRNSRQLTASEEKFRTLFTNLTEGVALHEVIFNELDVPVDYRIVDMNPAYELHTGLKREMVVGRSSREAYGTDTPPYLAEFGSVALSQKPYLFETYFPPLDRHFSISVISPRKGTFATVFTDITDQKKREEELRQKNDELVRFTYTVSHDLRSPLVTINAFLGYLEDDLKKGDKTRIETDFNYIRTAVLKMGNLLDELLRLSRVGRQNNPIEEFTLQEAVTEAMQMVAGRLTSNGVRVNVTGSPLTIRGDRTRITELFQNLLDNAAKFRNREIDPVVDILVENLGPEKVIRVRDNGIGIDPRHQKRLFGLFEKLDPSTEGTGMGLALIRRIVEVHGGRIWVESEGNGKGTSFCFTLGGLK